MAVPTLDHLGPGESRARPRASHDPGAGESTLLAPGSLGAQKRKGQSCPAAHPRLAPQALLRGSRWELMTPLYQGLGPALGSPPSFPPNPEEGHGLCPRAILRTRPLLTPPRST